MKTRRIHSREAAIFLLHRVYHLIAALLISWKFEDLAVQRVIHCESLADLPLAVDSHKELLNLIDSVMEDYPLNNIRLGVADHRINLEFANKSSEGATTFDSFGFMLAKDDPAIDTGQLHFTPLSTPRSLCQVGFLYPKQARPDTCARYAIDKLSEYLHDTYPDYFERYPLE